MSRCRCEQCCPDDPAPTWTRAFALACEARALMRFTPAQRAKYFADVSPSRAAATRRAMQVQGWRDDVR